MKIFWPHRSDAKGFSIENLARKYREKISRVSTDEISNQILVDRDFKSTQEDNIRISLPYRSSKRGHWANRDFSEYREAA